MFGIHIGQPGGMGVQLRCDTQHLERANQNPPYMRIG